MRSRTKSTTKKSKTKRRKFKGYQDNDAKISDEHAEGGGDFDRPVRTGIKLFKSSKGRNKIRILPRTWEDDLGPRHWAYPLHLHYGIGADNGRYPCRKRMKQGPCPICEERDRLDGEGDEDGARELRPSLTMMTWVIDRNNDEDGPVLFLMPAKSMESVICELSRDEDTGELRKVDHPEEGHDVTFKREGSGLKTKYTAVAVSPKATVLSRDEDDEEEWLNHISENPLPECINDYSYEYVAAQFGAPTSTSDDDEEEVEEEDDDEPPPRSRRGRRNRSRDDDDEEEEEEIDDEDEELDDEEEEEEPQPRRRGRQKTRSDDDEEEPRRRRRKTGDLRESVGKGLSRRRKSRDD